MGFYGGEGKITRVATVVRGLFILLGSLIVFSSQMEGCKEGYGTERRKKLGFSCLCPQLRFSFFLFLWQHPVFSRMKKFSSL